MGFLDLFKKKPEIIEDLHLGWLEVDMHSHLIPGIDDGSKTMEESLHLIKRMEDYGLRKIITTPHIMSEYYRNTPEIIRMGLEDLRKAAKKEGINVEIDAAAEYYMDEIFLEKIKEGQEVLTFGDNYILVETGFINKPQMLLEIIFQLEMAGFKPILAHPERYQYLIADKKLLEDLLDRNILFQVNLLSLTGFYSKQVKDFGESLLETGQVRFFGTDCHNPRYLDMLETLPKSKVYDKIKQLNLLNTTL
ncbi:capsular biosynthesis protein [Algoriphagus halophytocola]|uniref:protein-tyrosine-phosphatase n=1 Tax=Algoriphagus halophytocola TaxID=2991499 RepID=A0ABY6MD52_9BACT|nr:MULTISPECIES: CpsB/CapC family capsule biosynthesis tyrosine phosphatase [unclassified Algoriphagus]UZD21668.1 capsular biosynthesis protein [Algoriphagus sp. TR-M5]WBL42880.1 capsular biosynthesis protein [Algoriphagus sp. TR-M9]